MHKVLCFRDLLEGGIGQISGGGWRSHPSRRATHMPPVVKLNQQENVAESRSF